MALEGETSVLAPRAYCRCCSITYARVRSFERFIASQSTLPSIHSSITLPPQPPPSNPTRYNLGTSDSAMPLPRIVEGSHESQADRAAVSAKSIANVTSSTRRADRWVDWHIPEEEGEVEQAALPDEAVEGGRKVVDEAGLKLGRIVMAGPGVEATLRLFDLDRCALAYCGGRDVGGY